LASVLQATSTLHVRRALRSEAVSDELRSNNIFLWWQYCSHGEVFRHGHQECCTNLVLLPSTRNNHIMAEAEGYADYQFPRVSNEVGHRSSLIPVHPRSRRISLSAFRDRRVPGPTSEMSPRAPAQMGRREAEREGGRRQPETGVREVEIPRPSCSSRAQVGCACSRGLQTSTRERERAASCERLSRPLPRAANPL
jgi:hypothetical protein